VQGASAEKRGGNLAFRPESKNLNEKKTQRANHRELGEAVDAYKQGHMVLIKDEHGGILHETEFPKKMSDRPDFFERLAATQTARAAVVVRGVPADYWNGSHWPQTLKAARDEYLHKRRKTRQVLEKNAGASRDRTDDLIVAKDGVCQSVPRPELRLKPITVQHGTKFGLAGRVASTGFSGLHPNGGAK
jgi:hypothetical protein